MEAEVLENSQIIFWLYALNYIYKHYFKIHKSAEITLKSLVWVM
jgi:hypothetical protein